MSNTSIRLANMASPLNLMVKSLFNTTSVSCCLVFFVYTLAIQPIWAGAIPTNGGSTDNRQMLPTGDLNVFVFRDITKNGVYNAPGGETPIQGWQIKVFAEGANTSTDAPLYMGATDLTGNALFSSIPQGNYIVCEEMRSHWEITSGTVCRNVAVGSGTTNVSYSNFERRTYSFRKITTPATNTAVYFDWTLQDLNGANLGDMTVISDEEPFIVVGGPNLFTITELVPAGMKLVKVVCNGQDMTIINNGITFDTRPAETDVACVFYNEPICTPPSINDQPDATIGCVGQPVAFTVGASGVGTLSYQWQEDGINLTNNGIYSNVTTATLNISNAAGLNGKKYKVVVTSDNGTPNVTNNDCSTTSGEATLTVGNDTQAPTITCPANIARGTDLGTCGAVVTYTNPTYSDNCTGAGLDHISGGLSGSIFPKGTTTVTWMATDAANNTKTCTFRIIVTDAQAPTITCPGGTSQNAGTGQCSAVVSYPTPTASDNCTAAPTLVRIGGPASGSTFPVGNTTVIWRAIDGAGRSSTCAFVVAVSDNLPPSIICPQDIVQTNPPSACNTATGYSTPGTTDNCGVQAVYLLSGMASGSTFPVGTTVNTWRAIDNNGLSSTCTFSVTIICGSTRATPSEARANGAVSHEDWGFSLSPNPTNETVQMAWADGGIESVRLTIFDAQGRLVWAQTAQAKEQTLRLDVSNWAAGVYVVSLRSADKTGVKRLVVFD